MEEYIFFEESWNENTEKGRGRDVFNGRISSTRETKDDTERSW